MASRLITPSQKDVQYLYSKYSTIEHINILRRTLTEVLDPSFLSSLNYKNIHDAYNKILLKYYPNEICVKSNFINKVLMKGQNHITIFELPIGSSRADLCKINGTSSAYEIKTDLDNFSRLKKQLNDYSEVFDRIYVICSENNVKEITQMIPAKYGIYAYEITKRGSYRFNLVRESLENFAINPKKQLQLLRRKEYHDYFDLSDCVNPDSISDIIEHISGKYYSETINTTFKQIIKKRYQQNWKFLKYNHEKIYEIDYQWFFKNQISPEIIYK